jgi:ABC-type antimicrobial peptide transport system permease subunit
MSAVWMRARNELRSRWRALVVLALIAGLGGGAAIAAIAGARRTDSAYPRFLSGTNAYDDIIGINADTFDPKQFAILEPFRHLPEVVDSSLIELFNVSVTGPSGSTLAFPDIFPVASPDGNLGITFNRVKLFSGRPPDPSKVDEGLLTPNQARHLGARVGSTLTVAYGTSKQPVRVVGIGKAAGEIDPGAGGYIPLFFLTPAFFRANDFPGERQTPALAVRLRGGERSIPAVTKAISAAGGTVEQTASTGLQAASAKRTARFTGVGLEVFAGLAGLTVLAIVIQLVARQILLESDERETLGALGMTRAQMVLLSTMRVAAVAGGAALIAVVIAIAASPLFPIGPIRQLEVSPGIHLDGLALGVGAAGTIALIMLAGLWPAWRGSGRSAARRREPTPGTNKAANAVAAASFPPTAVAGVRMALESGHGETAVPVRTTILGTVLALIALTASLSFGASIHRLVSTPSLSGWNFDAIASGEASHADSLGRALVAEKTASSYALGVVPDLRVGSIADVIAISFEPGSFGPSVIEGRRPEGPDEIALGSKTMRTLHTSIGKTVPVTPVDSNTFAPLGSTVQMRIVGSVATPQFFFSSTASGNGAVVTDDFLRVSAAGKAGTVAFPVPDSVFVRFAPGVSVDLGVARIKAISPDAFVIPRQDASDLSNLALISSLPNILAGLLALVAAGTLVHTLTTSVRRRRRDLAILRALGFVRRQVSLTVVWQATTIILISLAIGLPVGVVAGRWGWHLFVNQFGYVPVSIVPLSEVLLTIPIAIILANAMASLPARAAARALPAVALRAE